MRMVCHLFMSLACMIRRLIVREPEPNAQGGNCNHPLSFVYPYTFNIFDFSLENA